MEIRNAASFLDYYEKVRQRTLRVLDCIPPEKLEWKYRPDRFSLGDTARHIGAIERYMYAETVQGNPSRYPGHARDLADGFEAVREFFDRTHRESVRIFAALTEEDLARPCATPAGAVMPTWKWMRSMVEHEIHHRGQLYLCLALLGVETPPLFGLTSEEVRARSRP